MNIVAMEILVKNQKGKYDGDRTFYFECPICKKTRMLVTVCMETRTALDEIEKNPVIRLICGECDVNIQLLNVAFDVSKIFKKRLLKRIYKQLGWDT